MLQRFFLLQYEKEFSYILDRLVRGIGTSRVDARKGFYSTLVALMVTYKSRIPSEKIIELMKKNLQTSGSCSKSVSIKIIKLRYFTGETVDFGDFEVKFLNMENYQENILAYRPGILRF